MNAELKKSLVEHGQEHLISFLEKMSGQQQASFTSQIEAVDLDLINSLYEGETAGPDWAELSRRAEPPPAMRLADRRGTGSGQSKSALGLSPAEAREAGQKALAEGKVGVLLVAGGQGSRLGFEQPKGMFPIGPISNATLLEIHLKKTVAIGEKYGTTIPVFLMTSPVTHDEQVAFLEENDRFGVADDDLVIFCQGTMPAVDADTGKLLMADEANLFVSPDGHGGTVAALARSGSLEKMKSRGIELLFYLQVDNPLAPIGDAEVVGYHLLSGSELTSIAVAKETPEEKLGNFVMIDDRVQIIEYSDFPADVAQQTAEDGSLKFWAGSIAIHVFDVAFLERMLAQKDAIPFHIAHKKVPHLSVDGKAVDPPEPNALKFERFIFDLLPHARSPIVVEYGEEECFAPLKNAPGAPKDTPEYVQRFLADQFRTWLEAAGAKVADGVTVEIDPLWAVDAETVAARVEPGTEFNESTYLRP